MDAFIVLLVERAGWKEEIFIYGADALIYSGKSGGVGADSALSIKIRYEVMLKPFIRKSGKDR